MSGSQPVPNWAEFHSDPLALNIRKGVFRVVQTNKYELYLLNGNTQLVSIMFDELDDAIKALNNSKLVKVEGEWQLEIKRCTLSKICI